MQILLETIDLTKTYRSAGLEVRALRGVNLRIGSGEMVAIMGPSGCGKSSLMHVLGAMTQPTSGRVLVGGKDIGRMDDRARTEFRCNKIGFVFQKYNLLPMLSSRANIAIARYIHGSHNDPEGNRRLSEILRLLQIEDKMDRRPAELSGGEQQRVAIARAVVRNPAIVLADEPTGNLDSENSKIVLDMFRKLNRKFGQTVVLVTHNPELTAYTDRVIEMRDGRVVGEGSVDVGWEQEGNLMSEPVTEES